MFDIELQQSDHLQPEQNSLPPSTSHLWEHNFLLTANNSQFTGMANYGVAEYSSSPNAPQNGTVPYKSPPARVGNVEGIPKHQQVIFPVNQENNQFGHALREIPGPTQATDSYPSSHHTRPLGPPTAENPRELANRYLHHPGSQVNTVCTERSSDDRCKVTIVLEVVDILRDRSSFQRNSLSSPQEESA